MVAASAIPGPEAQHALGAALQTCVDEAGFDPEPLYARARGDALSGDASRQLDAHLVHCLHCRVIFVELRDAVAEQLAQSPDQRQRQLDQLLRAASARSVEPVVAPAAPKVADPAPVQLQTLPHRRRLWGVVGGGVIAVAAAVTLWIQGPGSQPPPAAQSAIPIEAVNLKGMIVTSMGPADTPAAPSAAKKATKPAHSPPHFQPQATLSVTVRLSRDPSGTEAVPDIFGFWEKDGHLVALPDDTVVQRNRDAQWHAVSWSVPVGAVFGPQPGPRRLIYISSVGHPQTDFEGQPLSQVKLQNSVAWTEQQIEVTE